MKPDGYEVTFVEGGSVEVQAFCAFEAVVKAIAIRIDAGLDTALKRVSCNGKIVSSEPRLVFYPGATRQN